MAGAVIAAAVTYGVVLNGSLEAVSALEAAREKLARRPWFENPDSSRRLAERGFQRRLDGLPAE
jgi:hypothetical protein